MAMSVRDMAAALGVSKSQVARDKLDGMPMNDVAAASAWREANRDIAKSVEGRIDRPGVINTTRAAVGALAGTAGAGAADAAPAGDPEDKDDESDEIKATDTAAYRQARTEREQIRRDRERMELDQARGQLIDATEAARLAFTSFRALRDAVLNAPARLAPLCAAETDAMRIEQLIETELTAALNRVNPERLLAEVDTGDDEGD